MDDGRQRVCLKLSACGVIDMKRTTEAPWGRLPLPSPRRHAPFPLCSQPGCPLRPTVMERKGWCEEQGDDDRALQHCPSGQTSLHPPPSITARCIFTSSFHLCSSVHLSYHPALRSNVLVIMRWKWEVDALPLSVKSLSLSSSLRWFTIIIVFLTLSSSLLIWLGKRSYKSDDIS